ncbi:MAG TPA: sugar ABC transporter permease [Firmicutes bacterium]|nr:sugar ABC transporter permease [Bacillota bacterium]
MILFVLFTVVPVAMAIGLSFTYYNIIEPARFIGWDNYMRLFLDDSVFLISLRNTMVFAVVTGPLSYLACLLFAWFINELRPKIRAIATLFFYAPSISGNVFFIWTYIFSADSNGLLNGLLLKLGLVKTPVLWLMNPEWTLGIVMVVQLWMSLGTSFLSFIAGLQGVDRTLYESGALDGIKNRWQELWHITLPSMKGQLMFGAVMQITAAFSVADVSSALVGNPSPLYSAHTIVLHMMDYGTVRYEMGYACSIAVILFALTLASNFAVRKLIKPGD